MTECAIEIDRICAEKKHLVISRHAIPSLRHLQTANFLYRDWRQTVVLGRALPHLYFTIFVGSFGLSVGLIATQQSAPETVRCFRTSFTFSPLIFALFAQSLNKLGKSVTNNYCNFNHIEQFICTLSSDLSEFGIKSSVITYQRLSQFERIKYNVEIRNSNFEYCKNLHLY